MEPAQADIVRAEAELRRLTEGADEWSDACEAAAAKLARLMLDAGTEADQAAKRLQALGINWEGAWELIGQAERAMDRAAEAEAAGITETTTVCPHCMHPVSEMDHFCPNCAGPVTSIASMDPMGSIYSAGRAYRLAATDKKPRGIVVLAMWLIFGPTTVVLTCVLWGILAVSLNLRYSYHGFRGSDLVRWMLALLLFGGILALYVAILLKTTSHWLKSRREQGSDSDGEAE